MHIFLSIQLERERDRESKLMCHHVFVDQRTTSKTHLDSRDQAQIIKLRGKYLYLLGQFTSPDDAHFSHVQEKLDVLWSHKAILNKVRRPSMGNVMCSDSTTTEIVQCPHKDRETVSQEEMSIISREMTIISHLLWLGQKPSLGKT